jgi:hypothetical protein
MDDQLAKLRQFASDQELTPPRITRLTASG